jgi:hypothetical protein
MRFVFDIVRVVFAMSIHMERGNGFYQPAAELKLATNTPVCSSEVIRVLSNGNCLPTTNKNAESVKCNSPEQRLGEKRFKNV